MEVNVYDPTGEIVAQVPRKTNLDRFDGTEYNCGYPGYHLGLDQLADGCFVLIHSTKLDVQYQEWAMIISDVRASWEIRDSGNLDLLDRFGLRGLAKEMMIIS